MFRQTIGQLSRSNCNGIDIQKLLNEQILTNTRLQTQYNQKIKLLTPKHSETKQKVQIEINHWKQKCMLLNNKCNTQINQFRTEMEQKDKKYDLLYQQFNSQNMAYNKLYSEYTSKINFIQLCKKIR
eukprot:169037_1